MCVCAELANDGGLIDEWEGEEERALAAPLGLPACLHLVGRFWERGPKAAWVRRQAMLFPPLGHGSWEECDPGTGTVPCPLAQVQGAPKTSRGGGVWHETSDLVTQVPLE